MAGLNDMAVSLVGPEAGTNTLQLLIPAWQKQNQAKRVK